MNVLIVYAHPEPKSFNGAMRDIAVDTFRAEGHAVVVSDLHAMRFAPVVGRSDFLNVPDDPETFRIPREQTKAFETASFSSDIKGEMEKLDRADFLILQFPIWWFGMPAILKGWVDRVFARGFAYLPGRKYDTGMFRGKTAIVAATTGTSADTYAPDGIDGDIMTVLWPVHNGLLRYTGFDVLPPYIAYMPGRLEPASRQRYLEAYKARLLQWNSTPKLFFHPKEDYGPDERLRPGVLARSGVQRNV